MPSKSTFNHYNLTRHDKSKRTFNVPSFFGVEYKRSQLETQDIHATDIKNIVYKDKTNQKRSGYEQVAKAPYNVNGYFEYYDVQGDFHKIIHCGTNLYEITDLGKDSNYWETKFNLISSNMANDKSMAFSSKGILYILDGTKYRYLALNDGNLELNDVAGSDIVYVPTTSLLSPDGSLFALDDVNILTNLRKNKIEGAKYEFKSPMITSLLQSGVEVQNNNSFSVDLYSSSTLEGARQPVQDGPSEVTINAFETGRGQVPGGYYLWFETNGEWSKPIKVAADNVGVNNVEEWILDADLSWIKTYNDAMDFENNTKLTINGIDYFAWFFNIPDTQSFVAKGFNFSLENDYNNVVADLKLTKTQAVLHIYNTNILKENENENTIEIVFQSNKELQTDQIDKCTFGIVYNDRLFVSGNPSYKNTDWHTQPIVNYGVDDVYGDFTYFSDLDYCYYGSDNTALVGYDIFSDGSLIAIKEPSRFEPTLYRRYKELKVATSYTGEVVENQGTELYEEGYPCFPINTMGGEGGINNRSIINFLGETLVLTRGGLKKLYTRQNTYNNERIYMDVSSNINLAILNENLENAFLFAFKDRLLLKVGDFVYIAYDSLKENNEYEWYKLENINANCFFEIDGELYFGDNLGNICRFNDGEYYFKDRDRIFSNIGSTLPAGNTITISGTISTEISNGDKVLILEYFDTSEDENISTYESCRPMYYKIGDFGTIDNPASAGYTIINNEKTEIVLNDINDNFYDGLSVFLTGVDSGGITTTKLCILEAVEDEIGKYYIKEHNGDYVSIEFNQSSLYVSTRDKELVVANYNSENHTFNLQNELGENVDFYITNAESYSCIITHERIVDCYYITRPYDMGSIGYDKTIWQYTIANDTNLESVTDLGYLANRKQGISAFAKGSHGLRFDMYNFASVSFLNDGLPHIYTKYRVIPSVNFIRFTFRNLEDTNMVLSQLSFVYTISGQVRGSK